MRNRRDEHTFEEAESQRLSYKSKAEGDTFSNKVDKIGEFGKPPYIPKEGTNVVIDKQLSPLDLSPAELAGNKEKIESATENGLELMRLATHESLSVSKAATKPFHQ